MVVFRIADHRFAFRLDDVGEIIRVPRLAHMPLGPRSLEGLANLRGEVLPVVTLRCLLSLPETPRDDAARVIVLDGDVRVGFIVDRIDSLASVPAHRMEPKDAGAGGVDPVVLAGVVRGAEGEDTVKIFNPQRLLRDEFAKLGVAGGRGATRMSVPAVRAGPAEVETRHRSSFVSFAIGEQEYALPLDRVREIIPLPGHVAEIPRSETAVLGVVTLRDCLLPVVSLRALLGLPSDGQRSERGKVVVVSLGHGAVGLVVDATREILRVDPGLIDPTPTLLTRGAGDAEITSICRLDNGKRLVAVLSPDRLFRSELVRRVIFEQAAGNPSPPANGRKRNGGGAIHHLSPRRPGIRHADRRRRGDRAPAGAHHAASQGSRIHRRHDEFARTSFRSSTYGGASTSRRSNLASPSAFLFWQSEAGRRVSWSTVSRKF
jgi:purine-binding chemotaxis protein CheW